MIAMMLTMITLLEKVLKYKYLIGSLFMSSFLLTTSISIRAESATITSNESTENPYSILVVKDYFEIAGVFLDVGVILLLWKTVKDFAELAKVSKLQTEVRFRPWIGPSGNIQPVRDDSEDKKKQYAISIKNFGEIPSTAVTAMSVCSETLPKRDLLKSPN